MTTTYDPGDVFPYQDGIDPTSNNGTPVGYDLSQLLSESMRARAPWMSMAVVASNVLYQYVEQNRIALELSRNPANLSRVLKIATLKMLGLDWSSDYVSDDAYDRLLYTVSLYEQNHGPADFISYIGYALGFSMEMVDLWTSDYLSFGPGPQYPNIFQYAPGQPIPASGVSYPTSHVGLLYEQYAPSAPTENDLLAMEQVFYKIAPVNLVLEFIGSVVTASVGVLYMCALPREISYDEAIVEFEPEVVLSYSDVAWEETLDSATCLPLYPDSMVPVQTGAFALDTGSESLVLQSNTISWGAGASFDYSGLTVTGGYDVPGTLPSPSAGGSLAPYYANSPSFVNFDGMEGLLVERSVTLLMNGSGDPLCSNWALNGVSVQPTFTRYDGAQGYTVTSLLSSGTVTSPFLTSGTDCVVFTFRPGTTTAVTISRGADSITAAFPSKTLSVTSGITSYGMYAVGGGFYVLWAVITGTEITMYPSSGTGSLDWLDLQVVQGAAGGGLVDFGRDRDFTDVQAAAAAQRQ